MKWTCKPQQGLRREKMKQWFSPCKTYTKFYIFPGAAMQASGQTAVLNHVKLLFKINWNINGTVILQLSKSSICFISPLSVTCWTQLSFHRPISMPSSAEWKEGPGLLNILKYFHYPLHRISSVTLTKVMQFPCNNIFREGKFPPRCLLFYKMYVPWVKKNFGIFHLLHSFYIFSWLYKKRVIWPKYCSLNFRKFSPCKSIPQTAFILLHYLNYTRKHC